MNKTTANSTTNTTNPDLTPGSAVTEDNVIHSRNEIMSFSDATMLTQTNTQEVSPVPKIQPDPYMKEGLTEFLQRTYVYSDNWLASAVSGTLLLRLHFPNYLFAQQPLWDKIKNFAYFRSGIKIGIRVNGSKFHYGNLLVSWSPMVSNTGTYNTGSNNIFTAASNPSFTVSPSENEVHEFIIPYALPYPMIPMEHFGDLAYHIGCMSVHVLNPLYLGPTTTDVTFSIFMSFVDVELAGYTHITYPLPGANIETQATFPALIPGPPALSLEPEEELVAQGNMKRKNKEAEEKSTKLTVSGIAETVGNIAASLVWIPEIGAVAEGVSAIAGGIAGVARYFGFAMPNSLAIPQDVRLKYHNLANVHGLNQADVLSMDPENGVGTCVEMMGGKQSDMDILSIAQTPSLLQVGLIWSNAQFPYSVIGQWRVSPLQLTYRDATHQYETFLSCVSRPFTFWRGSIRVHMSIVCSQMHVGRLRVSWVPDTAGIITILDGNAFSSLASRVIDISQETEVSFSIPYLRDQMWLGMDPTSIHQETSNGWLVLSIVNDLNHPNVPVPNAEINLWVSAGKDFQVARPSTTGINWRVYNAIEDSIEEEELVAQGLTRQMIRDEHYEPLIPADGALDVGHTMGEIVTSIKELITRPVQWSAKDVDVGANYSSRMGISPFAGFSNSDFAQNPNYLQYFQRIFRYSRGSFVVKIIPLTDPSNPWITQSCIRQIVDGANVTNGLVADADRTAFQFPGTLPIASNLYLTLHESTGSGAAFVNYGQQVGQPLSAVIPYYATAPFQVNYGNPNLPANNPQAPVYRRGSVPRAIVDTSTGYIALVSAADDFEFGFMVGPLPILWTFAPPP